MILYLLLLIAAGVAVSFVISVSPGRQPPVREMVRYGRRYLKKFPDASEKDVRDALRDKFLPENPADRDRTRPPTALYGLYGLGGLAGGLAGSVVGDRLVRWRYEKQKAIVTARIRDALDDLFADDPPADDD